MKTDTTGLPTQATCDPENPEEHALWALVNFAGVVGAPLLLPLKFMRGLAHHLWRAGFRHHPELQEIYYQPPQMKKAGVWEGVAGKWVEAEAPGQIPESVMNPKTWDDLVRSMPPATRDQLRQALDSVQE